MIGEADSAEEAIKLDESLIMDIQELDDALYGVLTTLTDGEAGTIVENAKGVGQEAWRTLHTRFYNKDKISVAEISDQIRELSRPKVIAETLPLIQEFER